MYNCFTALAKVSVIIRVKNEQRWIGHAIQSSLDILDGPQIVVVDNSSTDESMDIIREFRHNPALEKSEKRYSDVVIKPVTDYTPGKALNIGVKSCIFDNILILSAHCVINRLRMDVQFESLLTKHGCIFGKQIPIYRGRKITPRYLWSHFTDDQELNMYSELENRLFLHNAFCFYRKDVLIEYPFDENISGKEDRIWAAKYVEANNNYLYMPDIVACHHYTDRGNTWKGIG